MALFLKMCFYFGCGNVINRIMWIVWLCGIILIPILCSFVYSRLTSFECTSAVMTSMEAIQKIGDDVQGDVGKQEEVKRALFGLWDDFMHSTGPFSPSYSSSNYHESSDGSDQTSIMEASLQRDVFLSCFRDVINSCKITHIWRYLIKAFFILINMSIWPCLFFVCCAGCVNRLFKSSRKGMIPVAPASKSKKRE